MRHAGWVVWILLGHTLLYGGYTLKAGKRPYSAIDRLPFHSVADAKTIPQKTAYYSKQVIPLSWSKQKRYDHAYNKRYFAPWTFDQMSASQEALTWQVRFVQKRKIYDSRKKRIDSKVWQWWIRNSNLSNMNRLKGRAISITHSNLRAFPTMTPAYRDPWKRTEGFPFDYNQNSELHLNVPLFVSHYSLDEKWVFVDAGHAFGWVKVSDIAWVNSTFMKRFKRGHYGISTKDNLVLYRNKKKITLVKLGTLFPLSNNKKLLYVAQKGTKDTAVLKALRKPPNALVAPKPIKFTSGNVAYVTQQFYHEPYGWGGKLYTRDCSATTRDFFSCFGIYLDRNSAKQAKAGKAISIKSIKKKEKKKKSILKYAKPFRSLLYVPGHIALYLGSYKNEPVILHTYWGIRLNNWDKYTLSRTIITTTEPGKEHPDIRGKSKLINTLQTIINF